MIELPHMQGKFVAVFGLGRTGQSAVRALKAAGAKVLAWDDNDRARDALEPATGVKPIHPGMWIWEKISELVLSPGVPLTHPEPHPIVQMALNADVPVVGDMELFVRALGSKQERSNPVIAVTGTNGKSTTTALIGHILGKAGYLPEVGGNIGKPVLDLEGPEPTRVYVLEVSSYQADLIPSLAPEVGVLLNIGSDHLDRHGDRKGYAKSKHRMFKGQEADDLALVSIDDDMSAAICAALKVRARDHGGARVVPFSVGATLGGGIAVVDGKLVDATCDPARDILDLTTLRSLRGPHNWQNIAAAYGAALAVGAKVDDIIAGIESFPGLAHRQERVGTFENVIFINDSKATNAEAAEKALTVFENIYWIAGGKPKDDGLSRLGDVLGQVKKAYLIGEAADRFARELDGKVEIAVPRLLGSALGEAFRDAKASGKPATVLLSPAAASFDQYKDFEARGDAFRHLVDELIHPPAREEGAA